MYYIPSQPFDWNTAVDFYVQHSNWFLAAAILYVPVIFLLKLFMKNRSPMNLKKPLAIWSAFLALFSLMGTLQTIPPLIERWMNGEYQLCDTEIYKHPAAFWVFVFNVSKVVEFGDTIFVILTKKPLIFLHWYHHIVTMLYCWYANNVACRWNSAGWIFASMNLFVHTVMYTYYTLTALNVRSAKRWGMVITTLQIAQMVIGTVISAIIFNCKGAQADPWGAAFGLAMYISYLILFGKLFVDKYFGKGKAE
jgi:elongation of very long chain fatty acids protein 6